MGLSARERQALHSIEGGLAESDPELVAKLACLSQLIEGNPAASRRPAGRQHVILRSLFGWLLVSRGRARGLRHPGWASAILAFWLVVTCALIASAAALSHGAGSRSCPVLAVHCPRQAPIGSQGSAR